VDPRAKESLCRMDIAEPRQPALIHEGDLDRCSRLEPHSETRTIEWSVERIRTMTRTQRSLQVIDRHRHHTSEPPHVGEPRDALGLLQTDLCEPRHVGVRPPNPSTRHAQVHQKGVGRGP
jgi:hypothetical protein